MTFLLGGKFLSQKCSFVFKHDSARKLNGFLLLSDVAFPQANQIAGKGHCERNIPRNGNQALGRRNVSSLRAKQHHFVRSVEIMLGRKEGKGKVNQNM